MKRSTQRSDNTSQQTDWTAPGTRLQADQGPTYWRSLEEFADTEAFQTLLHNEFPEQAAEWHDPVSSPPVYATDGSLHGVSRPDGVYAATGRIDCALCTSPGIHGAWPRKFMPPRRPLADWHKGFWLKTIWGVQPKSRATRSTRPVSALPMPLDRLRLCLYDPDRSQAILQAGQIRTWNAFVSETFEPRWKRSASSAAVACAF